jgi:hypothetical protein
MPGGSRPDLRLSLGLAKFSLVFVASQVYGFAGIYFGIFFILAILFKSFLLCASRVNFRLFHIMGKLI